MEEFDVDDFLEHHGTLGMKWGVWNSETAARYLGKAGNYAKRAISRAATKQKEKLDAARAKQKEASEKRKNERQEASIRKQEQKQFDKQTRKTYHLSAKEYNRLRETTLNSNDPSVVRKGMHLLTDKELDDKISRLEREAKIVRLATDKEKADAKVKQERREARQKTLGYKVAKEAGTLTINTLNKNVLDPGTKELFKRLSAEGEMAYAKRKKAAERSAEREEKGQERADRKAEEKVRRYQERAEEKEASKLAKERINQMRKEEAYSSRRKAAAEDTEKVVQILRSMEDNPKLLEAPSDNSTTYNTKGDWYDEWDQKNRKRRL